MSDATFPCPLCGLPVTVSPGPTPPGPTPPVIVATHAHPACAMLSVFLGDVQTIQVEFRAAPPAPPQLRVVS